MNQYIHVWLNSAIALFLYSLFAFSPAIAQVTPDTTLPNDSSVSTDGNTSTITGGTQAGSNLFHSFEQFSVPTNGSAYFNNALDIQNIISRVTGTSASNIDGLIQANGTANLFLFNPNGIIFGPNASLNIGGSFMATTADAVRLGETGLFSASEPATSNLLTVRPSALFFNAVAAQAIVNQSQAQNLIGQPNSVDGSVGLQVPTGQTLALVGGDVVLEGGKLTAAGGRIEIGSVAGVGEVSLNQSGDSWVLGYDRVNAFRNIRIGGGAFVDVSGEGAGNIQIQSAELDLAQKSYIFADTLGAGTSGDIFVRTTDAVTLSDGSLVTADVVGSGTGGNLTITTGKVIVRDSAKVAARTSGGGQGGNLKVNAFESVELIGTADNQAPYGLFEVTSRTGGLFTRTLGAESAGSLTITTPKLTVRDGAAVAAYTRGNGRAGNLTVNAPDSVEVIGFNSFLSTNSSAGAGAAGNLTIKTGKLLVQDVASISADGLYGSGGGLEVIADESVKLIDVGILSAFGVVGSAGSLTITAGKLLVQNGSALSAASIGKGGGGNITVTARESVELSRTPGSKFGAGGISALTNGDKDAGNVTISTGKLSLQSGGKVTTQTFGGGRGGNITVTASELVELIGTSADSKSSSGLFTTNSTDLGGIAQATGSAGDVALTTRKLIVRDRAEVNVSSEASGNAGSLRVQADSIFIDNGGKLLASTASQEGGNINLQVQDFILMRRQGLISAKAENNANGGNVTINAPFIIAVPAENSDIIANAFQGKGGNINITTTRIYGLEYRPQLTLKSDINASSQLGISGTVQINTLGIDPRRGLTNLPADSVDASKQIAQNCATAGRQVAQNELIVTGRGGLPPNPSDPLSSNAVWIDLDSTTQQAENRPSSSVATQLTKFMPVQLVEAQGWAINNKGEVVLTTSVSTATPHSPGLTPAKCHAS